MSVKETFVPSFGGDDFSVNSPTVETVDAIKGFLGGDPEDIEEIDNKKDTTKKSDKKDDSPEEKGKDKPQPQIKKPFVAEDLFGDDEDDEEDSQEEVEDDELPDPLKPKKKPLEKEEVKDKGSEESDYALLSKDLLNLGVFTPDEDEEGNEIPLEINTAEDFLKQFQSEVKKQTTESIQKFLGQYGPEYTDMFESVFLQGVDPYEYISRQAKIEGIENFDITSEENQEKIVRQWYKSQGIPVERIEARIAKSKNYGDLEEEAKEAKDILVAKEQTDLQNLAAQKQADIQKKQKIKSEYTSSVYKIINEKLKTKDFDGIPLDKKFAEQTMSYLTKDMYETKDKQTLTEFDKDLLELNRPENYNTKVKLAMLFQLLKTDPTLSKLGKRAISKESNKLFGQMEKKFGKSKSPTRDQEDTVNNW